MGGWQELLTPATQLVVAAVLGSLVGLERERREHPAGLRTNILVCVGAALFTLVSRDMAGLHFDPSRIAAQIVSGIGFLGAGTILRHGRAIRGLTTAAGLWVVAGIGMAVAAGGTMTWIAGFATLLVVFTLNVLNRLELPRVSRGGRQTLSIAVIADREAFARILAALTERRVELHGVRIDSEDGGGLLRVRLEVCLPTGATPQSLTPWLARQAGISHFEWE
jgi:putative Mg2+ transporter-C (MgtC) family protein